MVLNEKTLKLLKKMKTKSSKNIYGSYFGLFFVINRTTVKIEPLTLNKPKLSEKSQNKSKICKNKPKIT